MAKVDLDSVEFNMQQANIPQTEINVVIEKLKQELELAAAEKEAQPKIEKYKYIIANTDVPAGTPISETPMVLVEATEEVSPTEVVNEIKNAALEANNDVKKLQKDPIKNVFDAVERVQAKYFKTRGIRVISKTVTQLLETDNKLQ